MPKTAYSLFAAVLCVSLPFMLSKAEANENGRYSHRNQQWDKQGDYKVYHDESRGGKPSKEVGHFTSKKAKHKKGPQYKEAPQNVRHTSPAQVYHKPPARVYSAPPPIIRHYGSKYKHYYYKPRYVYITPYYAPRYYGHYPYRGFYWPFVNVSFVINLSARQIERHHQAVYAALDAPVGQVISWTDNGRRGTVVVLRDGFDLNGNMCKQYRQIIYYRGNTTTQVAVSCLTPEGYWIAP